MSTLRTAATFFVILLALGMGSTAPAQSGSRQIYPTVYEDNPDAADYRWAENPGSATVWVFREPVPPASSGGRPISDPGEKSQWPDPSKLVGKTSLVLAPHPEYSGDALRTAVEYPVRREGRRLRYLLVIETSRGIYYSRTLENARGNLPRYHTLSSPAHVRVGNVNPEWEEQARTLIKRVQQAREKRDVSTDTSSTASSESRSSGTDSGASTREASANSTTSSASWYDMSLFGWWAVGIGLLAVSVVVLFLIRFFGGSDQKNKRRSRKRSAKSRTKSTHNAPHPDRSSSGKNKIDSGKLNKKIDRKVKEVVEDKLEDVADELRKIEPTVSRVEDLEKEVDSIDSSLGKIVEYIESQREKDERESESSDSKGQRSRKTSRKVADTFVEWCQTAGGGVRKLGRFQSHLSKEMPRAEAHSIQYERDSMSKEFLEDADNGVSYWLVEADGKQFVLPHPTNRQRFGNLQPVYQGDAAPKSLEGIEPARLAREAGRLVLDEPGRVW